MIEYVKGIDQTAEHQTLNTEHLFNASKTFQQLAVVVFLFSLVFLCQLGQCIEGTQNSNGKAHKYTVVYWLADRQIAHILNQLFESNFKRSGKNNPQEIYFVFYLPLF